MRMVWPPQSPDLNPIEAMWDYVDSRVLKVLEPPKTRCGSKCRMRGTAFQKKFLKSTFSL